LEVVHRIDRYFVAVYLVHAMMFDCVRLGVAVCAAAVVAGSTSCTWIGVAVLTGAGAIAGAGAGAGAATGAGVADADSEAAFTRLSQPPRTLSATVVRENTGGPQTPSAAKRSGDIALAIPPTAAVARPMSSPVNSFGWMLIVVLGVAKVTPIR
jgi:hypothetical protein